MPWILIPLFWAMSFQVGFGHIPVVPGYFLVPVAGALGWIYGWRGITAIAIGGPFFVFDTLLSGFSSGDLALFAVILFTAWAAHTRRPLNRLFEHRPSDRNLTIALVAGIVILPLDLVLAVVRIDDGRVGYWGDLILGLHLLLLVLGLLEYPPRRVVLAVGGALTAGLLLDLSGLDKGPQGLLSPLLGLGQRDVPVNDLHASYGFNQPVEALTGIAYFWAGRLLASEQRRLMPVLLALLLVLWGGFDIIRSLAVELYAAPDFPAPGYERGDLILHLMGSREALILAAFLAGLTMGFRTVAVLLLVIATTGVVVSNIFDQFRVPAESVQIALAFGYLGVLARQAQAYLRTGQAIIKHERTIALVGIGAIVGLPLALEAPLMVLGMAAIYGWIAFAARRIKAAVEAADGALTADGWLPFAACLHIAGILWAALPAMGLAELIGGLKHAGAAISRLTGQFLAGGAFPVPGDEEEFLALAAVIAAVPAVYLLGRVIVLAPKLADEAVKAGLVSWHLARGSDAETMRAALKRPGRIAARIGTAIREKASMRAMIEGTRRARTLFGQYRRYVAAFALAALGLLVWQPWQERQREPRPYASLRTLEMDRNDEEDRALWQATLEALANYEIVERDFAGGRLRIGPIYREGNADERWMVTVRLWPAASGLPLEQRISISAFRQTLGWGSRGRDPQFADMIERSIYERARDSTPD